MKQMIDEAYGNDQVGISLFLELFAIFKDVKFNMKGEPRRDITQMENGFTTITASVGNHEWIHDRLKY